MTFLSTGRCTSSKTSRSFNILNSLTIGSYQRWGFFIASLNVFGIHVSVSTAKVQGRLRYSQDSMSRLVGLGNRQGFLTAKGVLSSSYCDS